nr:hypothetical protein CFP56_17478 [Quercus suber]
MTHNHAAYEAITALLKFPQICHRHQLLSSASTFSFLKSCFSVSQKGRVLFLYHTMRSAERTICLFQQILLTEIFNPKWNTISPSSQT